MSFTREQVDGAVSALGLDPAMTQQVHISPAGVHVVTVRDDGDGPIIRHGELLTSAEHHPIEEATDGDS